MMRVGAMELRSKTARFDTMTRNTGSHAGSATVVSVLQIDLVVAPVHELARMASMHKLSQLQICSIL